MSRFMPDLSIDYGEEDEYDGGRSRSRSRETRPPRAAAAANHFCRPPASSVTAAATTVSSRARLQPLAAPALAAPAPAQPLSRATLWLQHRTAAAPVLPYGTINSSGALLQSLAAPAPALAGPASARPLSRVRGPSAAPATSSPELPQAGGSSQHPLHDESECDDADDSDDDLQELADKASGCLSGFLAKKTKQSYSTYYKKFLAWLKEHDHAAYKQLQEESYGGLEYPTLAATFVFHMSENGALVSAFSNYMC